MRSVDIGEFGEYALRNEQRYESELHEVTAAGARATLAPWLAQQTHCLTNRIRDRFPISLVTALFRVIGGGFADFPSASKVSRQIMRARASLSGNRPTLLTRTYFVAYHDRRA